MFIGHYGPAFGAKAALPQIPLWVLFIAVQWMDVVWAILVMTGIEKVRIVPGFMEGSALDLYYMPYTHGLAGALVLSAILGGIVAVFMRENRRAVFFVVAACVFSHWILDLVVHKPELWIYDDVKVGFGLWRWIWISLPLELLTLFVGAWFYVRYVPARAYGNAVLWIFVALMAALEGYSAFGRAPGSPAEEAQTALLAYGMLALLASLVDLTRVAALQMPAPVHK
ncbi:MAG TPA: hypothetical protein VMF32_17135 [Xanthobacteraceae bacterium]|nr:hypothetical protein [Xanthobacteraceae bacterium]